MHLPLILHLLLGMKGGIIDLVAKYVFLIAGCTMFLLASLTFMAYKETVIGYFVRDRKSTSDEKVRALKFVKSDNSNISGEEFFSEDELSALSEDTNQVKITVK